MGGVFNKTDNNHHIANPHPNTTPVSQDSNIPCLRKTEDQVFEVDFASCKEVKDAEDKVISLGKLFKEELIFDMGNPFNLTIILENTGPYKLEVRFIKYTYIFMEYTLNFQAYKELNILNGNDFVFALTDQTTNMRTHFFALELNIKDKEINVIKEYFFLQKSLLETYYLNVIQDDQLEFLRKSFQTIKSRVGDLAVKPKGFFIHVANDAIMFDTLQELANYIGSNKCSRFVSNFSTFLEILDEFSLHIKKLILRIKFQVEYTASFLKILHLIFLTVDKFKEFMFIIEVGKSMGGNLELAKSSTKKYFSMTQRNRIGSSINFIYEADNQINNYKLEIDSNSISFFNFLYASYVSKKAIKKLYRKKAILLRVQKFFFVTFHQVIEDSAEFRCPKKK